MIDWATIATELMEKDMYQTEPILDLKGRVHPDLNKHFKGVLKHSRSYDCEHFFAGATNYDMPFNTEFDVIFYAQDLINAVHMKSTVLEATQQSLIVLPNLPVGWFTISTVHFSAGIPPIISSMPYTSYWSDPNSSFIHLTSYKFWAAAVEVAKRFHMF